MKAIVTVILLSTACLAFPATCIKKMLAIGQPDGDSISDFDLLDRYATKDMRVRETTVCLNRRNDLEGIQFTLKNPSNLNETLELTPLGNMDYDSLRCGTLLLTSEIEVLRASVKPESGIDAF